VYQREWWVLKETGHFGFNPLWLQRHLVAKKKIIIIQVLKVRYKLSFIKYSTSLHFHSREERKLLNIPSAKYLKHAFSIIIITSVSVHRTLNHNYNKNNNLSLSLSLVYIFFRSHIIIFVFFLHHPCGMEEKKSEVVKKEESLFKKVDDDVCVTLEKHSTVVENSTIIKFKY
jgi:hypothetical protein